jgi:polysaccharide export outer membrane protein
MCHERKVLGAVVAFCSAIILATGGLSTVHAAVEPEAAQGSEPEYVLGPDDQIQVWALGVEEMPQRPIRIDPAGYIDLPVAGRVKAAGLTVGQLRSQLAERLSAEVREPRVTVDITDFGSQPVSVLGAVAEPGVHQLRGRKTLAEVLSLAGGLLADAGPAIKITRRAEWGPIPLPTAKPDATNAFSVAEIKLKDFMAANHPAENIMIRPNDVISVPRAETIYVMGAVRKPGGFPLNERESLSVLQALSLAEGLGATPAAQNSKILRVAAGSPERKEIPIDLKKVLAGKETDVPLQPNDILFVPTSASKQAAARALEATIQTLSGVIIWRRPTP